MSNAHCEQSQKRKKQTILIYIENTRVYLEKCDKAF